MSFKTAEFDRLCTGRRAGTLRKLFLLITGMSFRATGLRLLLEVPILLSGILSTASKKRKNLTFLKTSLELRSFNTGWKYGQMNRTNTISATIGRLTARKEVKFSPILYDLEK